MRRKDLGDVFLTVISHARAANVQKMQALVGPCTWYVGEDEGQDYADADANVVVESGPLCVSRNVALRDAWNAGIPCVELSDDLTKVQLAEWSDAKKKIVAVDTDFKTVVERVRAGMEQRGALLGGAAPTSNPFYSNVEKPVHPSAFIVGDFIIVNPCDLLFDEEFTLKEDYDYTLQHIMSHGCVARRDDVLMSFQHRTNAGGAVAVRTAELEQKNIALLKAKWPSFIKDNPKRPNEILLSLPRAKR